MNNAVNLSVFATETPTFTFTARDRSNNVLDLTGATIVWRVGYPGNWAYIQKTGTITDAATGQFTVTLETTDTQYLRQRDYVHQAIITVNGVTIVAVRGRFRVYQIDLASLVA